MTVAISSECIQTAKLATKQLAWFLEKTTGYLVCHFYQSPQMRLITDAFIKAIKNFEKEKNEQYLLAGGEEKKIFKTLNPSLFQKNPPEYARMEALYEARKLQERVNQELNERFAYSHMPSIFFYEPKKMQEPLPDRWLHVLAQTPFPPAFEVIQPKEIILFYEQLSDRENAIKNLDNITLLTPEDAPSRHIKRFAEQVLKDRHGLLTNPILQAAFLSIEPGHFNCNKSKLQAISVQNRVLLCKNFILDAIHALTSFKDTAKKLADLSLSLHHPTQQPEKKPCSFYAFADCSSDTLPQKVQLPLLVPHSDAEKELQEEQKKLYEVIQDKSPTWPGNLSQDQVRKLQQLSNEFFEKAHTCCKIFSDFYTLFELHVEKDFDQSVTNYAKQVLAHNTAQKKQTQIAPGADALSATSFPLPPKPKNVAIDTDALQEKAEQYNRLLEYKRLFAIQKQCFEKIIKALPIAPSTTFTNRLGGLSL